MLLSLWDSLSLPGLWCSTNICVPLSEQGEACRLSSYCAGNMLCDSELPAWGKCQLRPGTTSTGGVTTRPPTESSVVTDGDEEIGTEKKSGSDGETDGGTDSNGENSADGDGDGDDDDGGMSVGEVRTMLQLRNAFNCEASMMSILVKRKRCLTPFYLWLYSFHMLRPFRRPSLCL